MSDKIAKKNSSLPPEWILNNVSLEAVEALTVAKTGGAARLGIVASIPIICKADKCPFIDTCPMPAIGIQVSTLAGQRCPVEISNIMMKFHDYMEEFNINEESANHITISLIRELIDYDIQIERADRIMAADGHFLAEEIVGVDANGRPLKNKVISKPVDYKERAIKKRHDILSLLHSTPKDKAGNNVVVTFDPSTYAAKLMQRAKDLQEQGSLTADYEVVDEE